jgi:hypothetical protein
MSRRLTKNDDDGLKPDAQSQTNKDQATVADVSTDSAISAHSRHLPDDDVDEMESVFDDAEVSDHATRDTLRENRIDDRCESVERSLDGTQEDYRERDRDRDHLSSESAAIDGEAQAYSTVRRLQHHIEELENQKIILHSEVSH